MRAEGSLERPQLVRRSLQETSYSDYLRKFFHALSKSHRWIIYILFLHEKFSD